MTYFYKRLLILLSILFFGLGIGFAQQSSADSTNANIYVNKKTGKSSSYSCAAIRLPDNYIKGSISVTTSGPVVYIPGEENKTGQSGLTGQVMCDITKAPAPGLDAKGRMYVEYEQPAGDKNNPALVKKMRAKVKFTIYSVKVYMKDTIPVCSGKEINIPCLASPAGGSYEWGVTGDITLLSKPGERAPRIIANGKEGRGVATLQYSIGGITYTAQSLVLNIEKPMIITPDTLTVYSGNVFTIKPKFLPEGGDCEWLVKEPLLLYGDNMNYGSAKIYAGKPGIANVSLMYKSCMATSKKNIVVIVKNSREAAANIAANTTKNPVEPQYNGYYGYGYFGYNNYYAPAANKTPMSEPGPYTTYKNSSKLNLAKPSLIENNIIVPDSIVLNEGEKQEVKPFIAPEGGSFNWEATGSISVVWASLKPTAYIEGLKEGTGYAKVTYTEGSKVIVKKIKVIVRD